MRRKNQLSALVGTLAATSLLAASLVGASAVVANAAGMNADGTIRMGGADRYTTAQAISEKNFQAPTKAVFLATGTTFPDALAAGPAAGQKGSPVLLTAAQGLSVSAASEIKRLGPANIYVMGGAGAVSDKVLEEAALFGAKVVRISGTDRYDTAASTSRTFWDTADMAYVAVGTGFADALAGGALAAKTGSPILLTAQSGLVEQTKDELKRLSPKRVVVLGGTGAISAAVETEIVAAVPGVTVSRIQGADRFATAAAVAKAGWPKSTKAMYASGWNFPDALAGVAAAAANDAPLLLTNATCMPPVVWAESQRLGVATKGILGGPGALTATSVSVACGSVGPKPVPVPVPVVPEAAPLYKNCTEVRAAGKAPIFVGDPGFQSKFDADNDGIGCEVY